MIYKIVDERAYLQCILNCFTFEMPVYQYGFFFGGGT